MKTSAFEARLVSRVFWPERGREVRAIDELSLTIPRGSFTALMGPSGSGKSTFLSLLGALDRPTHGELWFADQALHDVSDAQLARLRRRMGFVFQDFALLPRLSLVDNIAYPLIPRGIGSRERNRRARQYLEQLGLLELANALAGDLSGGERQRLALARALAGEPEVLLADEPTSNLDADTAREVIRILREFRTLDRTVIVATHDQQLLDHATLRFELRRGKLK